MSMRVISWQEFTSDTTDTTKNLPGGSSPASSDNYPLSTIHYPLAITIGVFDGVHLGHQSLIKKICAPPPPNAPIPNSSFLTPHSLLPVVVTFRQNPMSVLNPGGFGGDITPLEQKLTILETFGVQLTVLIDFSLEFSTMNGRHFIDLLLGKPVRLIAVGRNFRCGYKLDTGAGDIRNLAEARGVEAWIAPPVMDGGQPISSSRIRQALAGGRQAEAERLLGRSIIVT